MNTAQITAAIVLCAVLWPVAGYGALSSADAGTATGQFLKLGAGARSSGMGEAIVCVTDDASAAYGNPACIAFLKQRNAAFTHASLVEGIAYEWLTFVQPVSFGAVAASFQHLSCGSLVRTDDTGLISGDFNPADTALGLSYACRLKELQIGATLKYVSSKIEKSASAAAADIGAVRRFDNDKVTVGACLQNVGTKMKFEAEEDPLPAVFRAGASYAVSPDLLLAAAVDFPSDNETMFGAGGEYRHSFAGVTGALRLGYTTRTKDTGGLNGITVGLGVRFKEYVFDYAFVPSGELGNTHRFSVGIAW